VRDYYESLLLILSTITGEIRLATSSNLDSGKTPLKKERFDKECRVGADHAGPCFSFRSWSGSKKVGGVLRKN